MRVAVGYKHHIGVNFSSTNKRKRATKQLFICVLQQGSICEDIMVSCCCIWCLWCQMSREGTQKSYQNSANKSHDATSSNGSQPTSCRYAAADSNQWHTGGSWSCSPDATNLDSCYVEVHRRSATCTHTVCTEYMYVYSAHCLLYKSVSMYCLYVNCFCTVWSTLSRISLTKAHVLW